MLLQHAAIIVECLFGVDSRYPALPLHHSTWCQKLHPDTLSSFFLVPSVPAPLVAWTIKLNSISRHKRSRRPPRSASPVTAISRARIRSRTRDLPSRNSSSPGRGSSFHRAPGCSPVQPSKDGIEVAVNVAERTLVHAKPRNGRRRGHLPGHTVLFAGLRGDHFFRKRVGSADLAQFAGKGNIHKLVELHRLRLKLRLV